MAQITHSGSSNRAQTQVRLVESQTLELGHLLSRLQRSVLHPSPEREQRLRTSEYERARIEAVRIQYVAALPPKLEGAD